MSKGKVISPDFNINVVGAAKLEKMLITAQPEDGELIIDLSNCNFVASSGLRVFLKAAQRMRQLDAVLVIRNANDVVSEVFRVSGFDKAVELR